MAAPVARFALGALLAMVALLLPDVGRADAPVPGPRAAAPIEEIIVIRRRWGLPSLQEVQDYNAAELDRLARRYATPVRKVRDFEADIRLLGTPGQRRIVQMIADAPRLRDRFAVQ